MNPEQSVFLLSVHFFDVDFVEEFDIPFERTVIDFHGEHFDGAILRLFRFRDVAMSADHHPVRLDAQIDCFAIDTGEIDAETYPLFATISVDRRLPPWRRELKTGQPEGKILGPALQQAQRQTTDRIH